MTELTPLHRYLLDHRDELAAQAERPEEFGRELANLERFWEHENDERFAADETWRVLTRYPDVLEAVWAQGFQEGNSPASTLAAPKADSALDAINESESTRTNVPPKPVAADSRTVLLASRLTFGREVVAAAIAIFIVLASVVALFFSLFRVNSDQREAAREALLFLNGIVGVVLGYYFGRVPAETRAERADISARRSEQDLQKSMAEVQSVLDEMTSMSQTRGTRDGAQLTPEQLARLRALVRIHQ